MNKYRLKRSNGSGNLERITQLRVNFALVIVSLCLSLIIAELALRSMIPLDPRRPPEFRIPHPVLGWVLEPRASYLYQLPETTVSVTYNSQGWHDLEHTVEKPEGVFRILVLGDSFMEAYSVELDEAFHRRVEELASTTGRKVEVINLGVASYGTLQEYLAFREIGQRYEPDLVLLSFFVANDVMNNSLELELMFGAGRSQRLARPFLDPDEPTLWTVIPGDFEGAQRRYKEEQAFLDAQRQKLTERFILLRLARAGIRELIASQESEPAPIDKEGPELASLGVNYCVEPVEFSRAWDTTERILTRLNEDVQAIGGKLVVFTVPALEEVNVDLYEKLSTTITKPDELCLEETPGHTRLSLMLTRLDIEQITLLPDFRRVMREDGINLYHRDLHWNAEGHELAAERVVFELFERGLLPMLGQELPSIPNLNNYHYLYDEVSEMRD